VVNPILQLELQIAQNLQLLEELQQQQRVLSETLQELSRQLELLRAERAVSPGFRVSA
jgi:predicted metal-dependent phosphoesterase TrpH